MSSRYTILLLTVLILVAIFTAMLYTYQVPVTNIGLTQNNQTMYALNALNAARLENFLNEYNFSNETLLAQYYQVSNSNEMIVDCSYGIIPVAGNVPPVLITQNETAYTDYKTFVSYVGAYTLCNIDGKPSGCSSIKSELFDFIMKYANYTLVYGIYNETKTLMDTSYLALNKSNASTDSFYAPLSYDFNDLNAVNYSQAALANALIDLKPIPQYIFDLQNGSVLTSQFYIDVPFQYHTFAYPFKSACSNGLQIFNLIASVQNFKSQNYSFLYSGLNANVKNICINDSSNSCAENNTKGLNISFYVQGTS